MKYYKYIGIKTLSYTVAFALAVLSTGCSGLLDADNPNSLIEDDLSNPTAAAPMVNGSLSAVTRALANIYAPYSTATDELTWIGSRDAWNQLQLGEIGFDGNEFTDAAFFFVGEGRWWADEVILRLEGFRENGTLSSDLLLARAYLYAAIMYITIGDMFDDFALSNKDEGAQAIGPANMDLMYTTAIDYLNNALTLADNDEEFTPVITGMLARAHHGLGVWNKLNPSVDTSNPLVSNSEAISFAQDALTLMNSDFKFLLINDGDLPAINESTDGNSLTMPNQVNDRQEMRLSDEYVIPSTNGQTVFGYGSNEPSPSPAVSISLMDPIDNIPDPELFRTVNDFTSQGEFADATIVSTREMHLILAEAALAGGNTGGSFADHINAIRTMDGLTAYDPTVHTNVSEEDLLNHTRRTNLFLQGRRLADHYRFSDPAPMWLTSSDAVGAPGTFFPITISEVDANPNLSGG